MARVLTEDEVLSLPIGSIQWFEFQLKPHRKDLLNLYLMKGHVSKKRMVEYGITWRIWNEKPEANQLW